MLNLYILDKLDYYEGTFDIKWFNNHKKKMLRWAIMNGWRVDMPEIVRELKSKKKINF